MRSGVLVGLIVAVLSVCAIADQQPAQMSPGRIIIMAAGDPNDPNTAAPPAGEDPDRAWDPAEHLVANWESVSVSMTSQLLNPQVRPESVPTGPEWSISLRGVVDIIDGNGLIGWALSPTSAAAFDQQGRLISRMTSNVPVRMYQAPQYSRRPTGPGGAWESVLIFNQVSLNLPMEPDADYPDVLSRVEWTMNVLVAEEATSVDLPFEPNDTWVELVPGMEVLVETAIVERTRYDYRLRFRYDITQVDNLTSGFLHLWNNQQVPSLALLKVDVLDAGGASILNTGTGSSGSSGSFSGSGNERTGTRSAHGSCDLCGTAATLRFVFVSDVYEKEVQLAVEDVPVPHF